MWDPAIRKVTKRINCFIILDLIHNPLGIWKHRNCLKEGAMDCVKVDSPSNLSEKTRGQTGRFLNLLKILGFRMLTHVHQKPRSQPGIPDPLGKLLVCRFSRSCNILGVGLIVIEGEPFFVLRLILREREREGSIHMYLKYSGTGQR